MTTDLTQYNPPGVYVDDISQPMVTSVGLPGSVLCIVAPALGYQNATETVALHSATATALRNAGVAQDATLVVKTLAGVTLAKDTDYSVTVSYPDGADNPVTSLTRLPANAATASPGGLHDGDQVTVSYTYTSSSYYTPQLFEAYDLLASVYGPALGVGDGVTPSSQVTSPLSLAAKIAFENGAGAVLALPVQHATGGVWRDDYKSAYAKLVTDNRVGLLVAIFPSSEVATGQNTINYLTDLRTHCDAAAADGHGRMALAGAGTSYDETGMPFEDVATGVGYKRVVAVYPTRVNLYNQASSQIIEIDGGYLAAAAGGRLSFNDVERGLTRLTVNSFAGLPASVSQKMTRAFNDNLSKNGVCVVEQNTNSARLFFRHGTTTDPTSLDTREISLVRISDTLLQDVQIGLDQSGLIGEPLDDEMPSRVKGALSGILEAARLSNVIVAWDNLLVRQQSLPNGDPSVIECKFSYRPAVPLNYITVQFTLDLTAGTVDLTAAA